MFLRVFLFLGDSNVSGVRHLVSGLRGTRCERKCQDVGSDLFRTKLERRIIHAADARRP